MQQPSFFQHNLFPTFCLWLSVCFIGTVAGSSLIADEIQKDQPQRFSSASPNQHTSGQPLHNLIKISSRFYSGAEPDSEAAFNDLKQLGIKTIISVDGLRPNLKAAKDHGIEYYHIPFGYDSIPEKAQQQLTRVAREIEGPIYVHCHHGRHRGPAAMAIICQAAQKFDTKEAVQFMQQAGTSAQYKGLWKSVREFTPPDKQVTLPKLKHVSEVNFLVDNMAQMDRLSDLISSELKQQNALSTKSLQENALLLHELMFETNRQLKQTQPEKQDLIKFFKSAQESTISFQNSLKKDHNFNNGAVQQAWQTLKQDCRNCHKKHRN